MHKSYTQSCSNKVIASRFFAERCVQVGKPFPKDIVDSLGCCNSTVRDLDKRAKLEKRNARQFKKHALKPLDCIIKEIKTHKVLLEKT